MIKSIAMKSLFVIATTIAIITTFTSCVTTLQPLATIDKMITDQRITGNWSSNEGDFSIVPFASSGYYKELKGILGKDDRRKERLTGQARQDSIRSSKMYFVTYERNGVQYNLAASLVTIGENLFADLHPIAMRDTTEKAGEEDPFGFNNDYLPGYTIAKVDFINGSNLKLSFIDGEFIRNLATSGRMRLKHESDALFGTFVVTASSNELQQFVQKYARDPRVFNSKSGITLQRKRVNI